MLVIETLTHSMEQCHNLGTDSHTAGQEIPRLLWSLKANYRVHKRPPPVSVLGNLDPGKKVKWSRYTPMGWEEV
jgi:hypothetical protein